MMRRTGVSLALLHILPIPLTNARTASVCQNQSTNILQSSHLSITGNGSTDLLGTGSDSELALRLESVFGSLLDDRDGARHVLIRRVGAGANQANLELRRPAVLLNSLLELRDRGSQIGSEGTVDVGFELRQVL